MNFHFNEAGTVPGDMRWDTGIRVDSLAQDLDVHCNVSGLRTRPGTQTVTIQRSGGGGANNTAKTSKAGKKAYIRTRRKGMNPGAWRAMKRLSFRGK